MDSSKSTDNLSVNQTGQNLTSNGDQGLENQIKLIKNTASGKYKDVQDLRLKILQILEEIRMLRQENTTTRSVRYYRELENQSNELENLMRSVIRG
jgi:regulator of replication initiation timing